MKYKLIGLLIFLAGWANAQIGIDLTEMIPAPDSGYMIITTGDEYPERGLQKYVKAADVLGLDTMFQQGDSLCLLFRHEESYRCFPVHQAPRFEIIDEGLRVCWESRDTVWDTRAYLHFPGTSGSYVQARDIHDFEIGDQDAEVEVDFRVFEESPDNSIILSTKTSTSANSNGYLFLTYSTSTNPRGRALIAQSNEWLLSEQLSSIIPSEWDWMKIDVDREEGVIIQTGSGATRSSSFDPNITILNSTPATLGMLPSDRFRYIGDIRYFRFNDEYILFEESYGKDTLITNKGTVLDILGDVEWRLDTIGFTSIDTSHHCEVIPLTDKHLISVEHIGDSVRYTLSDSTIFTVRDSFIPQENIIGWIDERIPDTVFFAKTSTATKAIEFGDTLELKGGAININIPVEIDYFPATNQLQVCWTEIELPEGGLQQKPGLGEEFGQQENETQQLPADTIRLCDTIQLNDVFIDTVIHDGAGWVFYRNDGKIWSVRDSFRTDEEILDLIEMMNDPQWLTLDRQGNNITIGITEGNEVSFIDSVRTDADIAKVMRDSIDFPVDIFIDDFFRDGDSIHLVRSDGRNWAILDSVRSNQDIELIHRKNSSYFQWRYDKNLDALIKCEEISYLSFNGVSDYVESRNNYDINFQLPIFIDFIPKTNSGYTHALGKYNGSNSWSFGGNGSRFGAWFGTSSSEDRRVVQLNSNNRTIYELTEDEGVFIQKINGVGRDTLSVFNPSNESGLFRVGSRADGGGGFYAMDLYSFSIGDEHFEINEKRGDVLVGSKGTILDIYGAEWMSECIVLDTIFLNTPDISGIRDTLSTHDTRLLSLEYFRDTLGIPDITSFYHDGDSIHLTMNDGRSWTIPDLHFTEQEIKDLIAQESPVNRSWLLKDGGVPDNASDTVYRDGVAVIEAGEVVNRGFSIRSNRAEKSIGSQTNEIRISGSLLLSGSFLLVLDSDELGRISDYFSVGNNIFNQHANRTMMVYSADGSEEAGIVMHSGDGLRFRPYGSGQFEAEPTYLLGVDASGYIKEVRPTSGIDTIIHLGDSVFFDFDDKTFTIRDSVRSDAEIISLIEANRIFQQLERSGDFITLSDGGQVLDLHLKNVTHTGDSIRFHLSDGRVLTTRDSSLSLETVRDMILEEIPETVFYVKQGDVTAPVNWGDIVELENGTVNVNMPTKVKLIDSLNALEVCIWQVVDRTVVDTVVSDYVEFNGTNSSYGQRANLNAGIDLELPFSFRTSFSDLSDPEQTILSNGGEAGNNQFVFRLNTNDEFIFRNGDRIIQFPITDLEENVVYDIELRQVNDSVGLFLDGVLKGTAPAIQSGMAVSQIARQSTNIRPFNGRLYEIKSANAAVPIDEGSGNRLYGTGDIEYVLSNIGWGVDTVIRVIEQIDTLFQCDTIYLVDRFISDVSFENDTLKISRNDGKLFAIEIQASGGDGIDTMYSTSDSLYIVTSTGRTLSAGVAKGDKGDGLEYHWDGTRLGVRVENSGDPFVYVDLKGEKGDTGEDGREIELRVDSDIIQWRYVGDAWQTLIPLSALKGEKGDPGPGLEYHWDGTRLGIRKVGDSSYDYVDLKGEKGDPGDVVGDINIYKDDGVILEDRTAIIEEDNTLRFDLKEKAGFEIGHYSQDGNDSKRIDHTINDNSFMLEVQKIENDTLWNSRILATPKGIGLRNHKSHGSSISYGTMGIDTAGSYILNLVKDNPGVLFAGRRQFLNRVTDEGHALWDTIGITDIGITPADTARWGSGGGSDYTLVRDGYQTHLRDKDGVSKGFFQIGGTGGVEVYTQANNMYRIGINSDYLPQWSLAFSTNNALQLRRDNVTQSTVGFVGTGGINIQSTPGAITIDGSAIGGTQSLSFSPSLAQTTLSGGGGSFRIVGGSNTSVSLSAGGVYTISATGGGSMPSYSFNSQGAMLQLSEDGIQRGSYEVRAGTGLSLSTSGTALNRVVTINASGGTSPWTVSGSNIYRNSGVTIGGTSVANNQFRVYNGARFYNGIGIWSGSTLSGSLTASGNTVTMESSQNYYINSNNVRFKTQSSSAGAGLSPTATVAASEGSVIMPTANMTNGTMKIIINKRSSGHIRVFVANDREVHLPERSSLLVVYFDGEWYPQYIP